MVESEAHELSEEQMLEAVMFGQESYKAVIEAIIELAKKAAKDPWTLDKQEDEVKNLPSKISKDFAKKFIEAYKIQEKQKRSDELTIIRDKIVEEYVSEKKVIP